MNDISGIERISSALSGLKHGYLTSRRGTPGRCPGLVCFGPFGAIYTRRNGRPPRALPWAGLFRPLRGDMHAAQRKAPQGVALGWFVSAPSGRSTRGATEGPPGRCPGLVCFGRFGAIYTRRNGRPPRALPWAGLFRPLRGDLHAAQRKAPQGVALGWFVSAASGRSTRGATEGPPRRCPGLVCFGPFGAIYTRRNGRPPKALPWAGLFRPLRGDLHAAQRKAPQGVALGWFVSAASGRSTRGATEGPPGRCPGLVCFGRFGAIYTRRNGRPPKALPWAGLFRPLRGDLHAAQRKAPQGVALGWFVSAASGRSTRGATEGPPGRCPGLVCFGRFGAIYTRRNGRTPGRCPGLVCFGPFGAIYTTRSGSRRP